MKQLMAVCLFLCVLAGCKSKKEPESPDNAPKTTQQQATTDAAAPDMASKKHPPSAMEAEPVVVVTVNGEAITEQHLQQRITQEQTAPQGSMPESFKEQYETALRDKVLGEMIMETLLMQKIREKRIVISAEEINDCIERQCRSQKMNQKDFLDMLKAQGQTLDEYKDHIRQELQFEKLIETELSPRIEITEDAKRNYYLIHSQEYKLPEQVRISRIFLKVQPDTSDSAKADTQNVAEELLERLHNGGNFASLAKTYSDAPSAARGGDEGFFKKGQLKPELEKSAFNLAVGHVSELIQTEDGYHLLKVSERQDARQQSYDEVKDEIYAALLSEKIKESSKSYLDELKSNATIVYKN